jgi:hypothetical protein
MQLVAKKVLDELQFLPKQVSVKNFEEKSTF